MDTEPNLQKNIKSLILENIKMSKQLIRTTLELKESKESLAQAHQAIRELKNRLN